MAALGCVRPRAARRRARRPSPGRHRGTEDLIRGQRCEALAPCSPAALPLRKSRFRREAWWSPALSPKAACSRCCSNRTRASARSSSTTWTSTGSGGPIRPSGIRTSGTSADAFYDITAWSLPLTYRLDAWTVGAADLPPPAASEPVFLENALADPPPTRGEFRNPDAEYGFLIAGNTDHAVRAAAWLRESAVPFRVATAAFEIGVESFGRGALLVFAGEAPDLPALRAGLAELAAAGARVLGVDDPLTASGPHLGSDQFVPAARGRVAMVMGGPVRPSAYGSPWYLFERRFGLPFTALSWDRLATTDLRGYRILILPDGSYPDPGSDSRARLVLDHSGGVDGPGRRPHRHARARRHGSRERTSPGPGPGSSPGSPRSRRS